VHHQGRDRIPADWDVLKSGKDRAKWMQRAWATRIIDCLVLFTLFWTRDSANSNIAVNFIPFYTYRIPLFSDCRVDKGSLYRNSCRR